LKSALVKHKKARSHFEKMAPSYRKLLMYWVSQAKRPETKKKRVERCVKSLSKGKKLWGM